MFISDWLKEVECHSGIKKIRYDKFFGCQDLNFQRLMEQYSE